MHEIINYALVLISAGIFGFIVAIVYKYTHSRAVLSKNMMGALLIFSVLPAMIVYLTFIKGASALIGAVTLMRFRNPIKDQRDIVYILWSIINGFCCSCHQYVFVGIANIIIIGVLYFLDAFIKEDKMLFIIRAKYDEKSMVMNNIMNSYEGKLNLKYDNSLEGKYTELIYEVDKNVSNKDSFAKKAKDKMYEIELVDEINIVYQQYDMEV